MTLVYQAYGREDILKQSLFSVVSLLSVIQPLSSLKIVVATDRPAFFNDFFADSVKASRVEIWPVTGEQIKKWRGAIDFVHRVKIEIVKAVAARTSGPVFYVDGDTVFKVDPTALFSRVNDQTSLMHIAETILKDGRDPLSKKVVKFIKKNHFKVNGEDVKLTTDTVMWNAGALGISQNNKKWFDEVLDLTDQMHAVYPKHIMEQLAFSIYLQNRSQILSADREILHYWNQKDDYQAAIEVFLSTNKTLDAALAVYPSFSHPETKLVAPPKKSFWRSLFG